LIYQQTEFATALHQKYGKCTTDIKFTHTCCRFCFCARRRLQLK